MDRTSNQNLQSLTKMLRNNFSTFLLGLAVLLIVILLVSSFAGKNKKASKPSKSWTAGLATLFTGKKEKKESAPKPKQSLNTYRVKEGDSLWTIAQATYGSGYNGLDIAKANNLPNPDLIEPGQNLVLPKVTSKEPTSGEMVMGAATGQAIQRPREYTVQQGDFLWKIAKRFYGDGYAWVKIAHANNLQKHPGLIFAGAKLTLP